MESHFLLSVFQPWRGRKKPRQRGPVCQCTSLAIAKRYAVILLTLCQDCVCIFPLDNHICHLEVTMLLGIFINKNRL